jgi:membrane-bound serine protease (ClpP class)
MTIAVAAILIGIIILGLEVFIPSGGILLIVGLFSLVAGVTLIFFAPVSEGGGATVGFITIVGLLIFLPVFGGVLFYYWQYTALGKAVFLSEQTDEETSVHTDAQVAFEGLRGQVGKTATTHAPSGAVDVQGRRYDSTTEGMYLDAGQLVKVVAVKGNQLVVRPVTERELNELPSDLEA